MNERGITLLLAGDVMTGRGIDQILGHPGDPTLVESHIRDARVYVALAEEVHGRVLSPVDPSYVWGDALALLERLAPDAVVVNLETAVTVSDEFCADKEIHYRMHPRNVGCLTAAGVDVCSLANNHVLDFGRTGLLETLATLEGAGIKAVGAGRDIEEARRPARVRVGLRGAVLVFGCGSVSSGIPGDWAAGPSLPGVNLLTDLSYETADAVTEPICRYRRPGDVVVASIHWGSNWGYDVPADQVDFAHRLIDRGVDVIHGHSSHHVRPIEVYRGKLILYGCGDLVTDYEGIRGHEAWRGDLGVFYNARVAVEDGSLVALQMVPMRAVKMRLGRAEPSDATWLAQTLGRLCGPFGTHVDRGEGGLLALGWREQGTSSYRIEKEARMRRPGGVETVTIQIGTVTLNGDLSVPKGARGLVLFAHGSGSSRLSPRNRFVAEVLRSRALGTLLFDLLTAKEELEDEIDAHLRFDIPLLAGRLGAVTRWASAQKTASGIPIGYFGASTGAAAALIAAAELPDAIGAVVSRGGRPDLAGESLSQVRAPTLLIVGGDDTAVLEMNREALQSIRAPKELAIVPGATHLFEEPGTLEEVARLAANWFTHHLGTQDTAGIAAP